MWLCTRVELGGFRACCVFAFLFVSLPLFLSFLPLFYLFAYLQGFAFVVLVLSAFVALSLCLLFPLRTIRKERAQFSCVLSCPAVGCFIWLLLCIPRTRQVSARLYRNKVLEKGNLIECSKLFCARLCSYLCSSKFVFLLFSYLVILVGSYFLSPFGLYV